MSVIQGNALSDDEVDTGDIGYSLRFRRSASCYLNKTPPAAGDRLVWTYSVWFKRGELGTDQLLLDSGVDGNNESAIWINTSNKLDIYNYVGASYGCRRITTAVLRDPTSWNHLVVSSNGTTHFKIYLNGVELTAFDTNTGTNGTNWFFNSSSYVMYSGRRFNATNYFDGEKARECWVADSALTPSSFAYLNTEINEWVSKSQSTVKAVVDAGGTNSFMLDFDDATSLTTLGYDKSSKGNNWTLNNFSLTAGTTYDHMLDVPGNSFATWSEINKYPSYVFSNAGISFSLTTSAAGVHMANGTIAASSGKWYWEVIPTDVGAGPNLHIGLRETVSRNTIGTNTGFPDGYAYFAGGSKLNNAGSTAYGAAYTNGDVVGVAFDADAGEVTFYKNGATQGVAYTGIPSLSYTPAVGQGNGAASRTTAGNICTGQAPLHTSATYHSAAGGYFRYAPPTGFKALCQRNLPDVAIKNPELHHDVKLWTGNGAATQDVTGTLFQPDLAWLKARSDTYDHRLRDSSRGAFALYSNLTNAEAAYSMGLLSNGIRPTLAYNDNVSAKNYVAWLWKAGGTPVTNNAGSIPSQVSANVDAGFSIVTYTGTGANATVGHGLTKVPKLVIVKQRTAGTVENWAVSHTSIANTEYLLLNTTAAKTAGATYWNSTTPTTSVFSVGSAADTNESAKDFVAYCFADIEGYSKAFSYTGNASTDGVYVDLGFKPRWVLLKCSSTTGNWVVFDTTRDTYNVMGEQLYPNLSNAGSTVTTLDVTSRGFKARIATDPNSAQTFIGFAIADVAGKYSLGR